MTLTILSLIIIIIQCIFFFGILYSIKRMKTIKDAFDDIIIKFMTQGSDLLTIMKTQIKINTEHGNNIKQQIKESQTIKTYVHSLQDISKSLNEISNTLKKTIENNKKNQFDFNKLNSVVKNLSDNVKVLSQKRR